MCVVLMSVGVMKKLSNKLLDNRLEDIIWFLLTSLKIAKTAFVMPKKLTGLGAKATRVPGASSFRRKG